MTLEHFQNDKVRTIDVFQSQSKAREKLEEVGENEIVRSTRRSGTNINRSLETSNRSLPSCHRQVDRFFYRLSIVQIFLQRLHRLGERDIFRPGTVQYSPLGQHYYGVIREILSPLTRTSRISFLITALSDLTPNLFALLVKFLTVTEQTQALLS